MAQVAKISSKKINPATNNPTPAAAPASYAPSGGNYQDSNGAWHDSLGNLINPTSGDFDNSAQATGPATSTLAGNGDLTSQLAIEAQKQGISFDQEYAKYQSNQATYGSTAEQQLDYWKTHPAKTLEEEQMKYAAYQYATAHGIKGQPYPSQDELNLDPNFKTTSGVVQDLPGLVGLVGGAVGTIATDNPAPLIAGAAALGGNVIQSTMADSAAVDQQLGAYGAGGKLDPTSPTAPPVYAAQYPGGTAPGINPTGGAPGGPMATSTGNPALDAVLANAQATRAQNVGFVNNTLMPAVNGQTSLNNGIDSQLYGNLQNDMGQVQSYQGWNAGLVGQGYDASNTANATDTNYLGNYGAGLAGATAFDAGNYQGYANTLDSFGQLAAPSYVGDIQENQADLARQQGSYDQLSGISGGSLNYNAAQASSDYADVQNQQLGLSLSKNAANGSLDYTSKGAQAYANPDDVLAENAALGQISDYASGGNDVQNGQGSPEAKAAQLDALGQLKGLTTPQRTAAEEFEYEKQRMQEEQQEGASRAAVMENLRARGQSGSGMELANMLGSDQINSTNRLLGDLGTQATAVNRSMAALGDYSNLSSTMMGQGNQVAESNASNRLNAAGTQSQLAASMRNEGFNEAYSRGQSADQASQANQATQMQGLGQYNTSAANIRNASDAMSVFNTGQTNNASANNQTTMLNGATQAANTASNMRNASDAIATANQSQQQLSSQWNANYAQTEQNNAVDRATDKQVAANTFSTNYTKNLNDFTTTGIDTSQKELANTQGAINAAGVLGDKNFAAGQGAIADTTNYWTGVGARGQQNVGNLNSAGQLFTGVNTSGGAAVGDAFTTQAGDIIANKAGASLKPNPYDF